MWIAAILMLVWLPVAAYAGPLEDCEQAQDIDRRVHGCTARISQFPRDATAFFNRGSAYLGKHDLDHAIADYARVIQIDPAYSPAYYYRGIAYERRELYDPAIADLSRAVEINPRHGSALNARARIYLRTDQGMLALGDAERAVSLDPFDEEFRDTRAHVYEALGRIREATADYRRMLSGNPSLKSAIDGLRRLGVSPPTTPAVAASEAERSARPQHDPAPPRYSREQLECERAQYADPSGQYASYPCWARAALGPGVRGTRGR
jgi:tetratricopeptide (TPR) repeat protein